MNRGTTVVLVTSLTRETARHRADLITVDGYELALDLTTGERNFGSVTTVRFCAAADGAETFVDVAPECVRSAVLNGASLDLEAAFDAAADRLALHPRAGANELVVDAVMNYSHDGEGLHRHVDPADGRTYLYAMSFLAAAPRWYACFDQPDLKAPVQMTVRCPDDWVVRGNGPATAVEPGHWTIAATGPLATYFTTLVAGPYHVVTDEHDGIALSLLARRSLTEHLDREADELFAHTKHCFDELHALFGVRYPWGEYHQAFVPDFNAGAMENPGCVTFRDALVFRSRATESQRLTRKVTVAHEMAHMWFGDLVTMRWWDDLWLNESFAEYLGCRITGDAAWVNFGITRKPWGYTADCGPSTHPVAGNGVADAKSALSDFDGISYAKGAAVLRQLALHLGDDVFLDGLRRYVRAHAEGNAELADLLAAWTAAGATGLDTWTAAWLRTTGVDELSARGGVLTRRSPDPTARVHSVAIAAYSEHGSELAARRVSVADVTTRAGLDAIGLVVPDACDETWAKIVLPAADWQRMPLVLAGITDPRARVAVWNGLRLAVADAEVDPALALDIVVAALPAESDDAVLAVIGRWAQRSLAGCCLPSPARVPALARLSGSMLAVIDVAAAGSGRQLAAIRTLIGTTVDTRRLQAWLTGRDLPDGVVIDAELRWAIVHRLALLGEVDDASIGAELARDHSSQGAVHAARCRAARPDNRAKRAAWNAIMRSAERANYELYALAEGFWDPDQRELTDRYVPRYFEQIAATAHVRSGWVVDRLAQLAYPWPAVDPATVTATDDLLRSDGLASGIRRSVADAGDELRRAVAVRARYARYAN